MKRTLLSSSLLLCAAIASAQRPVGTQRSEFIGTRVGSMAKAVTDTMAAGAWFEDPNTQLTRFGALCGDEGAEFNCGFIVGTNGYGDQAKAQQFLLLDNTTAVVEGAIYWFYAKGGGDASIVHSRLYQNNGPGTTSVEEVTNAPNTVLANKDFTLADVDTTAEDGFTTVMFDTPVWVQDEFTLGFDVSDLGDTDSIGLLCTSTNTTDFPDHSWEKWDDGSWATLQAAWGSNLNVDLCIFALLDNSSVGIDGPGALNGMRMSFLDGNISTGTVRLGYDVVDAGRMNVLVHDARGAVVHEAALGDQAPGNYTHTFSTDGWGAGSYFVTLKREGMPLTKRLVVR